MLDVLRLALEPEKETKPFKKAMKKPKAPAKAKSAKPPVKVQKKKSATLRKGVSKKK